MAGIIKAKRLGQIAKELNIGVHTIVEHLEKHGHEVDQKPNSKLTEEQVALLLKDFQKEKAMKERANQINIGGVKREQVEMEDAPQINVRRQQESEEVMIKGVGGHVEEEVEEQIDEETTASETVAKETPAREEKAKEEQAEKSKLSGTKIVGKIDLTDKKEASPKEEEPAPKEAEPLAKEAAEEETEEKPEKKDEAKEPEEIKRKKVELKGPTVVGKIDLSKEEDRKKKPVASSSEDKPTERRKKKRRRRRISSEEELGTAKGKGRGRKDTETEISEKEIEEKLRETMSKIAGGSGKGKSMRSKNRRAKREERDREEQESLEQVGTGKLQVTEFISVAELASMMNVTPTEVISTCMSLGIIVSINQRLDAEVIELVADEFGFEVEFVGLEDEVEDMAEEDSPEDLLERAPIVTIMGHVDHGKTSLLDYIRRANVVAGEKGGITQHIGAYEVELPNNKRITFLDTPGHEAFTAMRARGAKITDIAVIVVAADDAIMPQTKEAISHAQAASVPMIFAINKVDKDNANPEKIKEGLANMNLLVEDWGGKYQSQEISAKTGLNIDQLMEKILLEAELLELKANPDKPALGTVLEASLDRGRGYVATVLIQEGTLKIGDTLQAGPYMGKVKALFNERGQKEKHAGPASPIQVLGLDGAPQAGEKVKVFESEQEAKAVAQKRQQIEREQDLRTQKHITLDEIGRRLALGNFKELNIIVKGDVDGSIEALSDSFEKLSTEEIQINIVHKAVGQITESDVLLASASDAIIVGFQVRPSLSARKLAEKEDIEIRLYSVIYDAIDEVKSAMEGMLEPKIEEKIVGNAEVRDVFKISRVGTIAGCYVLDGKISRNNQIRLVRDGIVVYTGELASLKRFKEDVKEVKNNLECGLNIKDFNDIKVGDIVEAFEEVEVKRKL